MSKFLVVLALVFSSFRTAPAQAAPWHWNTELNSAVEEAKAAHKPVLVFFFADGSPVCTGMDRETWTDATVQSKANGFVMTRLNVKLVPKEVTTYSVRSVPTTVFLDDKGKFTGQVVGRLSAAEASGIMTTALDRFERSRAQEPVFVHQPRDETTPVAKVTAKPIIAQPKAVAKPEVTKLDVSASKGEARAAQPKNTSGVGSSEHSESGVYVLDENGMVPVEKVSAPHVVKPAPKKTKKRRR